MDANEIRTPDEWQKLTGITILDPDGWRADGFDFNKPISEADWNRRMLQSTCRIDRLRR